MRSQSICGQHDPQDLLRISIAAVKLVKLTRKILMIQGVQGVDSRSIHV